MLKIHKAISRICGTNIHTTVPSNVAGIQGCFSSTAEGWLQSSSWDISWTSRHHNVPSLRETCAEEQLTVPTTQVVSHVGHRRLFSGNTSSYVPNGGPSLVSLYNSTFSALTGETGVIPRGYKSKVPRCFIDSRHQQTVWSFTKDLWEIVLLWNGSLSIVPVNTQIQFSLTFTLPFK